MQIKTSVAFVAVILLFAVVIGAVQFADDGLKHVRAQMASQRSLMTEVGVPTTIFALKARYTDSEREYGIVVVGTNGRTFRRVKVMYVGGIPQSVSFH